MIISYLMTLSWPDGWNEFGDVDSAAWELIIKVAGSTMGLFFVAVYIIATVASAIAAQASAARILYSMGRDRILPQKIFGHIDSKRKTPTGGIIAIGIVSLCGIFIPLGLSFSMLSFGALIGFVMVNIAVIAQFFIKEKQNKGMNVVKYLVVPILGASICFVSFIKLDSIAFTIGGAWILLGVFCLLVSIKVLGKNSLDVHM